MIIKIEQPILRRMVKDGKIPNHDMEYVLMVEIKNSDMFDIYFPVEDHNKIGRNIPQGTIVVDVRQDDRVGGYFFRVKDTDTVGHTNYAWALAENTPQNVVDIAYLRKMEAEEMEAKRRTEFARFVVKTLEIKK